MIRFIAAIDSKRGIANDHGIPWQGKIPKEVAYFRDKIKTGKVLMGYVFYTEMGDPFPGGTNYVANLEEVELRQGYELVLDARKFLAEQTEDVWNMGGAALFASTLDLADELYLTQLDQDFNCTKFFPEFKDKFELKSESEPTFENGITYTFQVWVRK